MPDLDEPPRMRRAPVIRAYDVGDTTVLVADDGTAHELAGASALLARAVLAFTCAPRSRAEILAHVESLTGGPLDDAAVVDQLLELLRSLRVLIPAAAPSRSARGVDGGRPRVLLGITGAIASAWTPGLIALLQRRGFEVRVVATEAALRFVQPRVIEALVHHPVLCSLWAGDAAKPAPHLELARWADAVLVCPASATTLARLAAGDHSTLLSAAVLSTRAPVLVAPSMNDAMYAEAAVQRNLAQLVADGVHVAHAGSGREVADAPAQRVAALGSAPPHAAVASLLEAALRIDRARRRRVGPPRDADEWDALYRSCADQELAWHTTALDDDLAAALGREAPTGARVLDLGTGLGVVARAAAARGCRVVATDISEAALARAEALAGDAAIVWIRDDISDSRLRGRFELIVDRGCLHLLPPARREGYAAAVERLTARGGALVIKAHTLDEGARGQTRPFTGEELLALLGGAFDLESDAPSSIPGPDAAAAARLFVLRRR